jgi:predicted transcriptional regulator
VLDRLLDRGLVERERRGKPYVYRPRYDAAEILAGKISQQLAATSSENRRDALSMLVEDLGEEELEHVFRDIRRLRKHRSSQRWQHLSGISPISAAILEFF